MILYYREYIATKCLSLFFFFAPKQMQLVYGRHILIASKEYIKVIENEIT